MRLRRFQAAWNRRSRIAAESGLHVARVEHLLNRYGTFAEDILALIREDPSLADPLPGADDYVGAEVVYAASHEGALHLEDVLARRTRISIEARDRGASAAPVAASLLARVHGWDKDREEREVRTYLRRVEAERASQLQPDDESADRIRLEAPDIVDEDAAAAKQRAGKNGSATAGGAKAGTPTSAYITHGWLTASHVAAADSKRSWARV